MVLLVTNGGSTTAAMETKVVPNKTYSRERTSSLMKELLHPEVSVAGAAAVVIESTTRPAIVSSTDDETRGDDDNEKNE